MPASRAWTVTGAPRFIVYVVDNDSDVGVIFETLNQRGKDLTELEKTKNYLLYLASFLDDGPRQQLAAAVNESWRAIFVNLGSAQLGPAHEDQLLRAHWLATQRPRQREREKIRSVKKRFHRSKYRDDKSLLLKDVSSYVYSLREASAAYRDIVTDSSESFAAYGADAADVRKGSRHLLQAGGVLIFAPLQIAARLRFPDDGKAYGSIVDLCERYSVRVFLINQRRRNAGPTRLYNLAFQLHRDGSLPMALAGLAERIRFFAGDEQTTGNCAIPDETGTLSPVTSTSCTSTSCTCSAAQLPLTASITSPAANSGPPRPSMCCRRRQPASAGGYSAPRIARSTPTAWGTWY